MSDNTPKLWQLARNGEEFGPYTSQELAAMGKGGRITSDMTVRLQGVEQWQNVSRVKGLHITQVTPTPILPMPAITLPVPPLPSAAAILPPIRSFWSWYGRTFGKWPLIAQIAVWIVSLPIPLPLLCWPCYLFFEWFFRYAEEWKKAHPHIESSSVWVDGTFTKKGWRKGHYRRK